MTRRTNVFLKAVEGVLKYPKKNSALGLLEAVDMKTRRVGMKEKVGY